MLSAKPVLASVDQESETARLIGEADCGWVIEPEDTPALVQAMQRLARADRADLEARGARGRDFAMEHLSKSPGVERLSKILLEAARRPVGTEAEPAGRVQSANP